MFQLCPDQPCGSDTDVGNGVKLPTIAAADAAKKDNPCIAFSVGTKENTDQSIPALSCMGDLIRINGKSS